MRIRRVGLVVSVVAVGAVLLSSCVWQGAWTARPVPTPVPSAVPNDLFTVDCVASGACIAAGTAAARWDGATWVDVAPPPVRMKQIGCGAVNDCLALAYAGGGVWRFDGTTWTATAWPSTITADAVSCASTTVCLVVGHEGSTGVARRWNGSTFTSLTFASPTATFLDVSCPTTTMCMLVGYDNGGGTARAERWTGSTTLVDQPTSSVNGLISRVSCQSATWCRAISGFQFVTWTGGTFSGGVVPEYSEYSIGYYGIACGMATCFADYLAIDASYENVSSIVRNTGTKPVPSVHRVADMDCSPTICAIVGEAGGGARGAWHFNGTAWSSDTFSSPSKVHARVDDVSCPTQTFCMATGTVADGEYRREFALTWNGTVWSPVAEAPYRFSHQDVLRTTVSCTSASFCMMGRTEHDVGYAGPVGYDNIDWWTWTGGTWQARTGTNLDSGNWNEGVAVSCASPTACFGVGPDRVWNWDGTTVATVTFPVGTIPEDVRGASCTSATRCVVATTAHLLSWNGTTFTRSEAPPAPAGQDVALRDVSCVGLTSCVAVGSIGPHGGGATSPYVVQGDGLLGAWTASTIPSVPVAALDSVSCPSTSECVAAGAGESIAMKATTWARASTLPAAMKPARLTELSCLTGWCMAIGDVVVPADTALRASVYTWTP